MEARFRRSLPAWFLFFRSAEEIERDFADVAPFEIQSEHELLDLVEHGSQSPDLKPREAKNIVSSMFRRAWETFCRSKGLYEHLFASQTAFHIGEGQTPWARGSLGAATAKDAPQCCATAPVAKSGNMAYPQRRSFGRFLTSGSKHVCCLRIGSRQSSWCRH